MRGDALRPLPEVGAAGASRRRFQPVFLAFSAVFRAFWSVLARFSARNWASTPLFGGRRELARRTTAGLSLQLEEMAAEKERRGLKEASQQQAQPFLAEKPMKNQ